MKSYNNKMFLGPGTIKFANGTEIPFTSCEGLEMEFSYDLAHSMSAEFRGTTIIPPREERKEMKNVNTALRGITVKFPGSNKTYDYIIADDGWFYLVAGDKIRITNEHFYNYSKAEVEIVKCTSTPTQNATMRIIAFTEEEDRFGWVDTAWVETVKHKWSEDALVSCFNSINTEREYYSFDKYFDNSEEFREIFKKNSRRQIDGGWITYDNPYYEESNLSNRITQDFSLAGNACSAATSNITEVVKELQKQCADFAQTLYAEPEATEINNDNFKGDDNMNIFSNFDFGKVTKDNYAMTLKGIAYRSIGDSSAESGHSRAYVQYNPETNDFEDVTPFILDINVKDFLFKMPVATSAIKAGDIILDMQAPVFVKDVKGSEITVVDPITREVRTILATKNAFNFNFVTKIVNLMDNFNLVGSASAENPFGNILPLMMLSDNKNMKDMLPLFLLGNGSVDFASNPMMLYFLMKDGKSNNMLPFLLMSNNGLFSAPAKDVE